MKGIQRVIARKRVAGGGGGGIVSFIAASLARDNNTVITATKPAGTITGHRIYAFVLDDTGGQAVTCPDFTAIDFQEASSSRLTFLYRDALTSDTTYDFTVLVSSDFQIHLTTLEKTAGTWSHTYNNTEDVGSITIPAVGLADNSMLLSAFGSDDATSISVAPADMIQIQTEGQGSSRLYTYREAYALAEAGVTKSATWTSGDLSGASLSVGAT